MIHRFRFHDRRDWFLQKRFGLFIHWGLYAIPAWQEQVLWRGRMPRKDYEPLIHEFNPVLFNPNEWLDLAEEAGMEYICFTAKHHDGFCMYDTKYTDYNVMNSPYGRDVFGMLAEACRRRGMVMGAYYSIPDWHHPNYPNQGRHHEMFGPRKGDTPDIDRYFQYMENQVTELCSNYGEIGQLFWDVNICDYNNTAFNDAMRKLQPSMVINNRGPENWDFQTPEREIPEGMEFQKRTEAVQSLGRESWGHKTDEDYYNYKYLMQSIDKVLAMGGNYQLNVGPRADGTLDERDVKALKRIGAWYNRVKESFGDCVPATSMMTYFEADMRDKVLLTRRGNTIYVHLYEDPATTAVDLMPFDVAPVKATLLNNGRELETIVNLTPGHHKQQRGFLRVRGLPTNEITDEVLIIRLDFDDAICE
jgi:alpha-L-fucosidase